MRFGLYALPLFRAVIFKHYLVVLLRLHVHMQTVNKSSIVRKWKYMYDVYTAANLATSTPAGDQVGALQLSRKGIKSMQYHTAWSLDSIHSIPRSLVHTAYCTAGRLVGQWRAAACLYLILLTNQSTAVHCIIIHLVFAVLCVCSV